ncbi:hypothetical protein HMPREF3144_03690 [Oligella sp. HMSC05A10]|uniref:tonB-system energizer ExbB n=1 Tax=Oligella sp. HMSC05A10 TaxID=1581112 RepID=UPI0008A27B73|nr:tonB-system energizer ExbB [Oligella sp. HMSC05A10]OFS87476.1 hypothetical protein HMPREF3144_03690 [Oligella sp. HMSC05A10]
MMFFKQLLTIIALLSLPAIGLAQVETPMAVIEAQHDMTPIGMYYAADKVVKVVIWILLLCSVITWTICLHKAIHIAIVKKKVRGIYRQWSDLSTLSQVQQQKNTSLLAKTILQELRQEVTLSSKKELTESLSMLAQDHDLNNRVEYRLHRVGQQQLQKVRVGVGALATIGAVAPFIGLFGTVWGIMNSFIGITQSKTTSLLVVAPGIAEALFATALGLVAAIPAVIMYNFFQRKLNVFQVEVSHLLGSAFLLFKRERTLLLQE